MCVCGSSSSRVREAVPLNDNPQLTRMSGRRPVRLREIGSRHPGLRGGGAIEPRPPHFTHVTPLSGLRPSALVRVGESDSSGAKSRPPKLATRVARDLT